MKTETKNAGTEPDFDRILKVLAMMQDDAEGDAMKLDGSRFDSRTVADNFGTLYADVKSLARIVEVLARKVAAL